MNNDEIGEPIKVEIFCPFSQSGRCVRDCAWYDKEYKCCAIMVIAKSSIWKR